MLQHNIVIPQIIGGKYCKVVGKCYKKRGSYPRVLPFTARVIREIHVLFVNQSRIIRAE